MRMVKVNPQLAQETVQYAFNGGVMESNDDNFVIRHDNNFTSLTSFLDSESLFKSYLVERIDTHFYAVGFDAAVIWTDTYPNVVVYDALQAN